MEPGAQVAQVWLPPVVHVRPLAQLAIAVQAVQVPVPLPRKPGEHVGQVKPLPVLILHVSVTAQFAMVPQSVHMLLLSKVPVAHAVHVPVPSPMKPGAQVPQVWLLPVVQVVWPAAQLEIEAHAVQVPVPLPR
jgi:hypothetical protein